MAGGCTVIATFFISEFVEGLDADTLSAILLFTSERGDGRGGVWSKGAMGAMNGLELPPGATWYCRETDGHDNRDPGHKDEVTRLEFASWE